MLGKSELFNIGMLELVRFLLFVPGYIINIKLVLRRSLVLSVILFNLFKPCFRNKVFHLVK